MSRVIIFIVFLSVVTAFIISLRYNGFVSNITVPQTNLDIRNNAVAGSGGGSATSGELFNGLKIQSFLLPRKFDTVNHNSQISVVEPYHDSLLCEKWSVVTTIFEPSDAVKKQALLPNWCLVVVGDKKGPLSYDIETKPNSYMFLNASMQETMGSQFPLVHVLPWNHFGRKNVGYLYAILHGAKAIWDFDDDNGLISSNNMLKVPGVPTNKKWRYRRNRRHLIVSNETGTFNKSSSIISNKEKNSDSKKDISIQELGESSYEVKECTVETNSFNPYPLMGAPFLPSWPRGFPLSHIKNNHSYATKLKKIPAKEVGIIQSLANHDPDVDAIYRLTQPIPFDFPSTGKPVAVPKNSYAPYNAQATLHTYDALWSLLLPVTVHGRVSDIWRGYITQRLFRDIGLRLVFSPSTVVQDRNVHNYLADFNSENDLYERSLKLIEQLQEWPLTCQDLPGRIEELWILMYEHGYLKIDDVIMVQAWLSSLLSAGYKFPKIV